MRGSIRHRPLTGVLVVAALLLTSCPQLGTTPTNTLPSPTTCETYTEVMACPCGAPYILEAWEDVNANKLLDDSDRPLGGIVFQATWDEWEQTTVDTCTGKSETSYSTGHKTAITDGNGKADLFVTFCCDRSHPLNLQIQVSESRGYGHIITFVRDAFTEDNYTSEISVRQAIAYCLDRRALIASIYPYIEDPDALLMDSFLPRDHWAYGGPYADMPQYDPEAGRALLEDAGWTLPAGAAVRRNADGEPLTLKFTTTDAQYRQTWGAVFVQNMAACGIEIRPDYVPATWWFGDSTGLARRDFELGAFAWVGQANPGGRSLYDCDQVPTSGNNWEGQNYMGWCNDAASAAIVRATNTLIREERIAAYDIVQREFARDVVSIPLFQRVEVEAWRVELEGVRPDPTEYATANLSEWRLADGGDTIVIGQTQEPDSLWAAKSSEEASALVCMAIGNERAYTQYAYDFQPQLQDPLSTIEGGLAINNDIEVKAGDKVYDTFSYPIVLEKWDRVFDKDGDEVEFDGATPVTMKQLVVTYRHKPFTWSDGTPGAIADFQLGYKIDCDPEAASLTCDSIQKVEWAAAGLEYAVTYLPGVQEPTCFLAPFTPYPSARVISDGRVLADVPADEWQTLPEINEMPLSWGPYRVVEWEKGRSITLEHNPYYEGEVATPNVRFTFLEDAAQAVKQLINGKVHFLDESTLGAGAAAQTVIDAARATGAIRYSLTASATWEHIDINLLMK